MKFLAQYLPTWCLDAAMSANQGLKELGQHLMGGAKSAKQ